MDRKIVLASASPRRRELLEQIGIYPKVLSSNVEEKIETEDPAMAVCTLSCQKAQDVAKGCEAGVLVIGADTVVSKNGRILGKPKSNEEAVNMLQMIQGGEHQVYTGVTLVFTKEDGRNKTVTFSEKTTVSVYPMSEMEIQEYVSFGEPMDKAGAYGIQGRFAAFIREIYGDYTNVVGLPLGRTYQEIKKLLDLVMDGGWI